MEKTKKKITEALKMKLLMPFMKDTDEEIDRADIEEEDWIEYMKRSTEKAMERMKTAKIQCWIKTHRRMKWRSVMRIASLLKQRWVMKAANSARNTKHTELWEDRRKDGKMKSMSSSEPKMRQAALKDAMDQDSERSRGLEEMENRFAMTAVQAHGTSVEGERLNVHDT